MLERMEDMLYTKMGTTHPLYKVWNTTFVQMQLAVQPHQNPLWPNSCPGTGTEVIVELQIIGDYLIWTSPSISELT